MKRREEFFNLLREDEDEDEEEDEEPDFEHEVTCVCAYGTQCSRH
jgi:hypothetical protein